MLLTDRSVKLGSDEISNVRFFKPRSNAAYFADIYQKKFLCIDREQLEIYGDFS